MLALGLATALTARADTVREVHDALRRGDTAAALARADAALKLQPRDAQARFLRGLVLLETGRDREAREVFTALAQEYPELPEPLINLALLQVRSGELEPARQSLEAALRNDPAHRLARVNLAEVHLLLAVHHWQAAAASAPLEPALQRRLEAARALAVAR
jgi:Flp pilus assembly protein TadD